MSVPLHSRDRWRRATVSRPRRGWAPAGARGGAGGLHASDDNPGPGRTREPVELLAGARGAIVLPVVACRAGWRGSEVWQVAQLQSPCLALKNYSARCSKNPRRTRA
jgi:hypothetical protein